MTIIYLGMECNGGGTGLEALKQCTMDLQRKGGACVMA